MQKKNRAEVSEDADDKLLGWLDLTFEVRAPAPGRRHVVTEVDVRRFLRCIPDWEAHSKGLKAIVLGDHPDRDCLGFYDYRGIIYLCPWEEDLFWQADPRFFAEHEPTLLRLGVPSDPREEEEEDVPVYFDESSARAFQLVHIFLHELGHHRDMRTATNRGRRTDNWRSRQLSRGEEYAETWALHMEELVWPRYKEFFGVPGPVRIAPERPARRETRVQTPEDTGSEQG